MVIVSDQESSAKKTVCCEYRSLIPDDIRSLIESGVMERITIGYYRLLTIDPSEAVTIARLFPEGVQEEFMLRLALFSYADNLLFALSGFESPTTQFHHFGSLRY